MTNKTEDKFYFGKSGQPERFGESLQAKWDGTQYRVLTPSGAAWYSVDGKRWTLKHGEPVPSSEVRKYDIKLGTGFSRRGQPERFAAQIVSKRGTKRTEIKRDATGKWAAVLIQSNQTGVPGEPSDEQVLDMKWYATEANARTAAAKMLSARPGQPERFAATVPQKWIRQWENSYEIKVHDEKPGRWTFRNVHDDRSYDITADSFEDAIARLKRIAPSGEYKIGGYQSSEWRAAQRSRRFSSPGQPDKFDASSLERGSFAEASKSPILGKLLSEKAMPEGGWRAVQAGSDTLVISFEDGDVAGNFARRVAGKGYSATSPVQAIGRYWNVEVKNGK